MIISHKHKFIFIKTKKTAGTSIEIALSKYCDDGDIITPISPNDELLRKEFGKKPINYKKPFFEWDSRDFTKIIKKRKPIIKFYNHIPAKNVKDLVCDEIWNTYYKFSFDRNPWDKVISSFYYKTTKRNLGEISFEQWFSQKKYLKVYNYPLYTDEKGEIMVDFLGKYETLNEDLQTISNKINLDLVDILPRAKGNYRTTKKHYSNYYNEDSIQEIRDYFKNEIELLNYTYEDKSSE